MSGEALTREDPVRHATPPIAVEFLFLDLTACTRCLGTERNLDHAVNLVTPALAAIGRVVQLRKILVESEAHAHAVRLVTSPTIRVNGQDVMPMLQESVCDTCSALTGTATDCRVWEYQGQASTEAPVGLLVETILRGALGADAPLSPEPAEYAGVPDSLRRFFAVSGRQTQATIPAACCAPAAAQTCCLPTEKAACCGTPPANQCGCR